MVRLFWHLDSVPTAQQEEDEVIICLYLCRLPQSSKHDEIVGEP